MNLQLWVWLSLHLLTFALGLQALEIWLLSRSREFNHIWSYENLSRDLESGLPLPNSWIRKIFSQTGLVTIAWTQMFVAFATFVFPYPLLLVVLLLTHLSICIRFRGTFNGGSDMMVFVILTGLIICQSTTNEKIQKLGLIYIAIHTLYSYFKAGLAKVIHKDWQNGFAVPAFLERSLYSDMKSVAGFLKSNSLLSLFLGWSVLFFELSILVTLLIPPLIFPYFLIAAVFHFINYIVFGLNRFFLVWMSAWPAVIYSVGLIGT